VLLLVWVGGVRAGGPGMSAKSPLCHTTPLASISRFVRACDMGCAGSCSRVSPVAPPERKEPNSEGKEPESEAADPNAVTSFDTKPQAEAALIDGKAIADGVIDVLSLSEPMPAFRVGILTDCRV
jgi:hypothetical protein